MEDYWKSIIGVAIVVAVYLLITQGLKYYDDIESIKAVKLGTKDYCSLASAMLYFSTRDECCKTKLSCGNKRGSYSNLEKKCKC